MVESLICLPGMAVFCGSHVWCVTLAILLAKMEVNSLRSQVSKVMGLYCPMSCVGPFFLNIRVVTPSLIDGVGEQL